jgi:hypothetical protein
VCVDDFFQRLRENERVNCRGFACIECKILIDSGYRWGYWQLEDRGIVTLGRPVEIPKVLDCEEYWNFSVEDPAPGGYLQTLMPEVRRFLVEHGSHTIVFGEAGDFAGFQDISPYWRASD